MKEYLLPSFPLLTSFLTIWLWFLLWYVWPFGSHMTVLIFLAYKNLHTPLLVVYSIISPMAYILVGLTLLWVTWEPLLNQQKKLNTMESVLWLSI